MSTMTLLDEELALLAPAVGPRPWLDALSVDDHDAVLVGSARSLLVRGLAAGADGGLEPLGDAAGLLAHLVAPGREVHLQVVLDGVRQPDLTVLRPLASGEVLWHDVSPDGVHLLSLLDAAEAREQLSAALDPHGVARGAGSAGGVAVVRVRVIDGRGDPDPDPDPGPGPAAGGHGCPGQGGGSEAGPDPVEVDRAGREGEAVAAVAAEFLTEVLEEVAVSVGDVLGRGRVPDGQPGSGGSTDPAVALTALDEAGLAAWVDELLTRPWPAG